MKSISLALLYLSSTIFAEAAPQRFHVDDQPGANDLEKIQMALTHMKETPGEKELHFSQREYVVEPFNEKGYVNVLSGSDLKDLTILGNGATIIAKNALNAQAGAFIKFDNFQQLTIKGLKLTYRPLPYIQGKITWVNQTQNRVFVKLDKNFNHSSALIKTLHSEFWCRVGRQDQPHLAKANHPSWMPVKTNELGALTMDHLNENEIVFRAGNFNIDGVWHGQYNWAIGDPIVIWKRGAQDAFSFEGGTGLSLQNVTIDSALHFAIKLRGVRNAQINHCSIEPVEGGMISGSADGVDVQQSTDISITNNRMVATGDDMISLLNHGHGLNGLAYEKKFAPPYPETNQNVTIENNHLEGGNRNGLLLLANHVNVSKNIVIGFRQYGLKFSGDHVHIQDNTFEDGGHFTAYRHIEDEQNTGIICSDDWKQNHVIIERNIVRNWSHMPALLLKSVVDAQIIDNRFEMDQLHWERRDYIGGNVSEHRVIEVTTSSFMGKTHESQRIKLSNNELWNHLGKLDIHEFSY